LKKDHPDRQHLRRSAFIKIFVATTAIAAGESCTLSILALSRMRLDPESEELIVCGPPYQPSRSPDFMVLARVTPTLPDATASPAVPPVSNGVWPSG
jgi:hypothetical protein